MAYSKTKSTKRKRTTKKKTGSLKMMVKREISKQIETKERIFQAYTYLNSFSWGSGAQVIGCFGDMARGTEDGQRVGDLVFCKSIYLRMAIEVETGNLSANYNNCRIVVVTPKSYSGTRYQPNDTQNFVRSVFYNQNDVRQYCAPIDTDRWKVLYDKTKFLQKLPVDGVTSAIAPQTWYVNKFIKVNAPIRYDTAQNVTNDIYIIAVSDSNGAPNAGAVAGFVKCYYKDA